MSFSVIQGRGSRLPLSQLLSRQSAWRRLPLTLNSHNWSRGLLRHCWGSSEAHVKTVPWLFGPFQQHPINWGVCHSSCKIEHLNWAIQAQADLTSIVELDTLKCLSRDRDEILPRIDTTEARSPVVVDGFCWMTIERFCTKDDTVASVALLAITLKF